MCRKKIPKWNRADSKFCEPNCRSKAYDIRKGRIKLTIDETNRLGVVK